MNEIYLNRDYVITTNMLDCYDRLKLSSILDLTQAISGEHADLLDIGFSNFIKKGLIWVVIRTKFEFFDNPKNIKKLNIRTSLATPRLFECPRDYEIKNDEEVIAKGRSIWAIYDINNKKIVLPNDYETLLIDNKGLFPRIKKIELIDKNLLKKISSFKVPFSMLDHNLHMNNTHYLDLFFDVFKPNKIDEIQSFQVEYVSQCYLDDVIDLYIYENANKKYLYGYIENNLKFYIEVTFK
ncbi:MAG: thioesterase [Mollicutes bacterium]|nr:thioesterase [Mollicutes bacterium]MDD7264242.1 thioesterase [bacterium]MDY4980065.1 thioesterase [Candidatus Onthovivens sp.]